MASRKRSRGSRTAPPVSSSTRVSDTSGVAVDAAEHAQDSAVLRSSFDTQPYEESGTSAVDAAAPKAFFVGEQIIYKDRDARIAEAAYLRAERRGFEPGYELDDWLAAEKEIDALLSPDADLSDANLSAR